jgi:LAO/AO transport system kinase
MVRLTDPAELVARAGSGDRRALARLVSLVEDDTPEGAAALAGVFADTGRAWTTGLTGAPGAGKSTVADRLVTRARMRGDEVAVVAVDPSSPFTGGAILGDRIRMQDHISDAGVFIRSMASRGHLGGIAVTTPRVVTLLDGVGFPEVLVETVGVGQVEVEVAAAVDTTVVVVNPRWGDSIQAAKAGLLEVGDVFVVNKADRPGADDSVRDLRQMLELGHPEGWWPPIVTTVASTGEGIDDLGAAIDDHRAHLADTGTLAVRRQQRLVAELASAIDAELRREVRQVAGDEAWEAARVGVIERRVDPWTAARGLMAAARPR